MIFSGASFGGAPFAAPPLVDESVTAPFTLHLAKLERDDIYQFRGYPRYKDIPENNPFLIGTQFEVLYQDREWIGVPMIQTRLAEALDFHGSVSSGFSGLGSGGAPQVGAIRILGDTQLVSEKLETDVLGERYAWNGAEIEVRLGGPTFKFEEFGAVFTGRAVDLTRDRQGVRVVVADPSIALDVSIQENLFGGTGGLDGDERLAGVPRPQIWGILRRWPPVLIDRFNNVFQVNDGPFEDVLEAYELGHADFTRDPDVADIYGQPAPALGGHYYVCKATGHMRFRDPPTSLTIDVKGDNGDGYVETVADIIEVICRRKAGYTDVQFDLPSFVQCNADAPYPIGFAITGAPTVAAVVDQILGIAGDPVGLPLGFRTHTRLGQLRIGVHKFRDPVRVIRGNQIMDTRREITQAPFYQWRLGYARRWSDFDKAALNLLITDPERDFVEDEYRYKVASDLTVQSLHDTTNRAELNTLMDVAADANTEANRALTLTSEDRNFHVVQVIGHQWHIREGDTVTIEGAAAYGHDLLDGDYLVLGLGEVATTDRVTTLELWG